MKPTDIEYRAIQILEKVKEGRSLQEDIRVELKSDWGEDRIEKMARQIAGHANAARGEPILWLIGVDENNNDICGAPPCELSAWAARIKSQFETGHWPQLTPPVNVPYGDVTVYALRFETDRPPYVIKNPEYGVRERVTISYEVPWREANDTRTATRSQLLKILVPLKRLPETKVLDGQLLIARESEADCVASIFFRYYIAPTPGEVLTIPYHECTALCEIFSSSRRPRYTENFENVRVVPASELDYTRGTPDVVASGSELVMKNPAVVVITGNVTLPRLSTKNFDNLWGYKYEARVYIRLRPSSFDDPLIIDETTAKVDRPTLGLVRWLFLTPR